MSILTTCNIEFHVFKSYVFYANELATYVNIVLKVVGYLFEFEVPFPLMHAPAHPLPKFLLGLYLVFRADRTSLVG